MGLCEFCAIKCSECSTNGNEVTTCEGRALPHKTKGVHLTPTLAANEENFSFIVKAEGLMFPELKDIPLAFKKLSIF